MQDTSSLQPAMALGPGHHWVGIVASGSGFSVTSICLALPLPTSLGRAPDCPNPTHSLGAHIPNRGSLIRVTLRCA